jgi:hypothetical protein
MSTSRSKRNATSFASPKSEEMIGLPKTQISNLFKENNANLVIGYPHEGYMQDRMYIDDNEFDRFFQERDSSLSLVATYDTRNLMADDAIFAILTDEPLDQMRDK